MLTTTFIACYTDRTTRARCSVEFKSASEASRFLADIEAIDPKVYGPDFTVVL